MTFFDQELEKFKKRQLTDDGDFPGGVCWDYQDEITDSMKYEDCQRPGFLMDSWDEQLSYFEKWEDRDDSGAPGT